MRSELEEFDIISGVGYNHDATDVELARLTESSEPAEKASRLIALRALDNPQWRAAFERRNKKFFPARPGSKTTLETILPKEPFISAILKASPGFNMSFILLTFWFFNSLTPNSWAFFQYLQNNYWVALMLFFAGYALGPAVAKLSSTASRKVKIITLFAALFVLFSLGRPLLLIVVLASVFSLSVYLLLKHQNKKPKTSNQSSKPWSDNKTLLGSSMTSVKAVSNLLRVHADGYDIGLKDASDADLAASALAADLWLIALGADEVLQAASYGPDAIKVMGAILSRAAGNSPQEHELTLSDSKLEEVETALLWWGKWLENHFPSRSERETIKAKVVSDLSRASLSSPLNQAALTTLKHLKV